MTNLIKGHPASWWLTHMVAKVGEQLLTLDGEPLGKDKVRYVGRGPGTHGKFGNPFTHRSRAAARWVVPTRENAVTAFEIWLNDSEQAELRQAVLDELAGKVLVCHCQTSEAVGPACHAEVLVRMANPWLAALEAAEKREGAPVKLDMRYPSHLKAWAQKNGIDTLPKVLVTGDREFAAAEVVKARLAEHAIGHIVIEGEARGADRLARDAARSMGLPVAGYPARWTPTRNTPPARIRTTRDGRSYDVAAGPIRNGNMLACDPDLVLAFHDNLAKSSGTLDAVQRAMAAGKTVILSDSAGSHMQLTHADLVEMAGLTPDADADD